MEISRKTNGLTMRAMELVKAFMVVGGSVSVSWDNSENGKMPVYGHGKDSSVVFSGGRFRLSGFDAQTGLWTVDLEEGAGDDRFASCKVCPDTISLED